MARKVVSGIMLTLLLIGLLALAFNIQSVKSSGTIYIRTDGSVDPPTAPIQRDGDIYTFTGNINDSIVVERNNIVVDGAGYTVQGTESGTGVDLSDRSNVTIKNTNIKGFGTGVALYRSSNNTISGNTIANNDDGIVLYDYSDCNIISGNNIRNNWDGIELSFPSGNIISGNNITDNISYGLMFLGIASDNSIYHNNFINNSYHVGFELPAINTWDDGYPSGGNYWSDYEERYPNATELDDSGIWDTPYVIDEKNQDNYPKIPEFPSVTILPLFMITTLLTVIVFRRKHSM